MRIINTIFFIVIVLLGISFACLNASPVSLNYYFGEASLPLSMLIVFVLGIGLVLGLIASVFILLKVKTENRRLKGKIKLVEKEIENIRAIPLRDQH